MRELFFKGTPQLETERLILRKLKLQDADDIFEYAADKEVTRYLTWETHKSVEDARKFINFILDKYKKDEAGEWGIVLKETGKLIGSIGMPWHDKKNKRAEIGFVLSRKYWGQGIMPEAVNRVLQFAFAEMGLNRIECCHALHNEKSGRVMQKVGMSFEGIAREKILAKNKFWDVKQYAILRSDWERLRKTPSFTCYN
ncbi:MAG: GNAT family N-acetyltransferase [Firmicutes bacterium]|jgi:ribosomal-protein-alanine N-acetyltransferase|nr:GNAT family N-acetyltransferase [Bacillota bacterium]